MLWERRCNLAFKSVIVYFKTLGEEVKNKSCQLELAPIRIAFLHTIHCRLKTSHFMCILLQERD